MLCLSTSSIARFGLGEQAERRTMGSRQAMAIRLAREVCFIRDLALCALGRMTICRDHVVSCFSCGLMRMRVRAVSGCRECAG